ncbi:MAG TPA: hypothetical protein ENN77_00980, partial [Candidatus Wirthbacteria bacterium]|nr:hypothetical protein [Candidatus Wirthbacteria bacterium]
FKGGRGVATAAGILFLLNPTVGLSIFIFYMFAGFLNYYGIYKVLSLPIDNAFATFIGIIWYVGLSSIQSNTPASTIGLYLGLLLLFRRITINPKEYKHPGFYKIFIYRLVYDRPTLQKPINRLEKKWKELQSQQLDQSLT